MAAQQAARVTKDKEIIVIETKSILQGISACLVFNPNDGLEANIEALTDAVANVKSGSVTYAIKDTSMDGKEIHAGDFMGIQEKEIVSISKDRLTSVKELLDHMISQDSEIVTLIYGEEANAEEVAEIEAYIQDKYEVELDVQEGNQPVYTYFIGVE